MIDEIGNVLPKQVIAPTNKVFDKSYFQRITGMESS